MVDGDVDSAEAVTDRRYEEVQSDGTIVIKSVLERLDSNTPSSSTQQIHPLQPADDFNYDPNMQASPPPTPEPKKRRVSLHNIS
jgi:hypothetical protein